jgi:hypothetical protein
MVQDHTPNEKVNQDKTAVRAAQALLDRGWGKPRVEVVTNEQPDSYIKALQAVSARLDASQQSLRSRSVQVATPSN